MTTKAQRAHRRAAVGTSWYYTFNPGQHITITEHFIQRGKTWVRYGGNGVMPLAYLLEGWTRAEETNTVSEGS